MARDAIARQYDVDKNAVNYLCETDTGRYRPGKITFAAKHGKSLDLHKMRESIAATRLSGGTNMSMDYLEITATGQVVMDGDNAVLKVSGTNQRFVLQDASKETSKLPLQRLREALNSGVTIVSVTGRVEGWSGRFPVVLAALAQQSPQTPTVLLVTDFETSKK
jgi:hypothetical protein